MYDNLQEHRSSDEQSDFRSFLFFSKNFHFGIF